GGTVNLDDAVIDLGSSTNSSGLTAANPNPGEAPKTINANHVTIVGGSTGSVGVRVSSTWATKTQASTVSLTSSIIRGPATSLFAEARNNGSPLANSTATINVAYSDYDNISAAVESGGVAKVVRGAGNVDVDPRFVSAATGDYPLAAGSPGVDKGSPAAGGPTTDRDGHARVTDGDGNGTKVADMGAYERPTLDRTPPNTRLTAHPAHKVRTATVRFVFASTEPHSTFRCKLDKRAYKTCTAPHRISIGIGKHTFSVKAVDASGNIDPSAVTWKVQRLKKRHR
ncbi:MAG TPA: choice-of-anchor Q domain-containing protein, partial [Marmoricola sp.]|nr:choice-of-anchor Q domain-containing protein [Marmoricola sp.]